MFDNGEVSKVPHIDCGKCTLTPLVNSSNEVLACHCSCRAIAKTETSASALQWWKRTFS